MSIAIAAAEPAIAVERRLAEVEAASPSIGRIVFVWECARCHNQHEDALPRPNRADGALYCARCADVLGELLDGPRAASRRLEARDVGPSCCPAGLYEHGVPCGAPTLPGRRFCGVHAPLTPTPLPEAPGPRGAVAPENAGGRPESGGEALPGAADPSDEVPPTTTAAPGPSRLLEAPGRSDPALDLEVASPSGATAPARSSKPGHPTPKEGEDMPRKTPSTPRGGAKALTEPWRCDEHDFTTTTAQGKGRHIAARHGGKEPRPRPAGARRGRELAHVPPVSLEPQSPAALAPATGAAAGPALAGVLLPAHADLRCYLVRVRGPLLVEVECATREDAVALVRDLQAPSETAPLSQGASS